MIEIRVHGRGGQGAVTSTELIALAAIGEGKYAQAFPSFGPERRGAVKANARFPEHPAADVVAEDVDVPPLEEVRVQDEHGNGVDLFP